MNFKRRFESLERQLRCEPSTLLFADGSSIEMSGRGDYVMELVNAAVRGERTPQIELMARSVRSKEAGGGHLLDLARALLNGPVGEQGSPPDEMT